VFRLLSALQKRGIGRSVDADAAESVVWRHGRGGPLHPIPGLFPTVCRVLLRFICFVPLLLAAPAASFAAPYTPNSDQQVLERLPSGATAPRLRELAALRRQLNTDPRNVDLAVQLARRYYEETAAEGDPRFIGYAQAALAPWWSQPDPPPAVRVIRAVLQQFNHQFDAAMADLAAAAAQQPDNAEAWAWQASITMVQARYAQARAACERLAPLASPLIGVACTAAVDAVTGRAAPAATALRAALQQAEVSAPELLWALTRLAEIEERRGDFGAAEAAFKRALSLGITDGYLLAAYADFLLDRGRAAEVLTLLQGRERSDLLLLRLALAAKTTGAPALPGWSATLSARFDAARLRRDSLHEKEEARFLMSVLGQPARALPLAVSNFAVQREPADARVLLEAALAAGQPEAAAPALKWMAESGIESVALQALATRLRDKP
jgi:tetratricopeptide (TPR) repeat protein